jgi:hypothetical protein
LLLCKPAFAFDGHLEKGGSGSRETFIGVSFLSLGGLRMPTAALLYHLQTNKSNTTQAMHKQHKLITRCSAP